MKPLFVFLLSTLNASLAACGSLGAPNTPAFSEAFVVKLFPVAAHCSYRNPISGEAGWAPMTYQTTMEVRVSSNEPIDKNLGEQLDKCLTWFGDMNPGLAVKLVNTCKPPLGIHITENDVSILGTTVTQKCGE